MVISEEIVSKGYSTLHIKKTDELRKRKIFTLFPLYINSKFSWFQYIIIKERKYIVKRLDFDDGWSYQSYWTKEVDEWEIEDIIRKK